jgi:cytochrome c biogenesis protein CcdA
VKRHPFDAISFIFGAVLLAIGVLVAAGDTPRLLGAWLVPAFVIGLGLLLLLVAWQSSRTADAGESVDEA